MEPYQEAAETTRRSGEIPLNAVKYGAGIALGAGGSMIARNVISKMLPLLSSYIPQSFAKKALSKIDPRIGSFIKKAEDEGFNFDEVKDFISQKIQKSEQSENPKENRNVIEQYDPELHSYIKEKLGKGLNLLEAGKQALSHPRFKKAIESLTKDHKTSWDAILSTVYGQSEKTQPPPQEQMPQQPQQSQGGQMGPGQQALMAILDKINQKLGQ